MGARHDSNLLELISGACSEQREVDVSYVLFSVLNNIYSKL